MYIPPCFSLDAAYQALTPDDPTTAYAWLFDGYPYLPGGNSYQETDDVNKIDAARHSAITATYQIGGAEAVLSIAEHTTQPAAVGQAFGGSLGSTPALSLALEHVGSEEQNYREMAHGILWVLYQQSGWQVLEDAIAQLKAANCAPNTLADIFLIAPPEQETWDRLATEESAVQRCYWAEMNPWRVSREEENISFVAEKLLEVQRSATVAQWTVLSPIHHEIVIRTLEQLPADLAAGTVAEPGKSEIIYDDVVALLSKLDESNAVDDSTIAFLEIPFISALPHWGRSNLAVYREIAKDPAIFADLISQTHRRDDGQSDNTTGTEPSPTFAEILVPIIFGQGEIPGKADNGSVEYEALSTWVNDARRLCSERGRGKIGDDYIGNLLAKAPTGVDGIWPCETVRELLESIGSTDLGEGFVTGKIRLRGATTRGVFEGGYQESTLADSYQKVAGTIGSRWPFTATLLRSLASRYEQIAEWHDREADERDQFEP